MIRFGIIGTNWITERWIAGATLHPDFQLTAVYSRTEETAVQFARKHAIAHTFTDIAAMASSGLIDALYIASPNSCHSEQAIIAMNHGIHVLCEKPMASNMRELEEMLAAAKSNQVALMEAVKSTLMPGFGAIRDHLEQVGQVRRYYANFCQYSSRYDAYKEGKVLNAFKPELSNGALVDIGIYCIYPAVVLFGRPVSIHASGYLLDTGVDGEGSILLKYEDMDAVMMFSKITNSSLPSEIQGENGNLIIDKISEPTQIELRYRNGQIEELTRSTVEHNMFYEVEEFIHIVKEGRSESLTNSWQASCETMRIMDEVRKQLGVVYPADSPLL